jgi:hypothetical protein
VIRSSCRWLCAAFLPVLFALGIPAHAGGLEVDLLGWRLQQFNHGVPEALGEPFKTIVKGDLTHRAYRVGTSAYLVIAAHRDAPSYVHSLQFTGHDPGPELVRGLHLGDPREKVIAALGPPDRIESLDISPIEPLRVEVFEYDAGNFSVEIDPDGNLYSLRLRTNDALLTIPRDQASSDPWQAFVAAVASGRFDRLEPLLRPDVEIYMAGDTLANRRRYRDFVAAPPPDFLDAFFDPTAGVVAAASRSAPEAQLRVTEKMGVGRVYKFPADSPLEEVVFFPYLGTWRVYEVRYRDAAATTYPVERG